MTQWWLAGILFFLGALGAAGGPGRHWHYHHHDWR
jgi:hypothetical protein